MHGDCVKCYSSLYLCWTTCKYRCLINVVELTWKLFCTRAMNYFNSSSRWMRLVSWKQCIVLFSSSAVSVLRMKDVCVLLQMFLEVAQKRGMRHLAHSSPLQRPLGWELFLRKTAASDWCRNHPFPSVLSLRIVGVWLFIFYLFNFFFFATGEGFNATKWCMVCSWFTWVNVCLNHCELICSSVILTLCYKPENRRFKKNNILTESAQRPLMFVNLWLLSW